MDRMTSFVLMFLRL